MNEDIENKLEGIENEIQEPASENLDQKRLLAAFVVIVLLFLGFLYFLNKINKSDYNAFESHSDYTQTQQVESLNQEIIFEREKKGQITTFMPDKIDISQVGTVEIRVEGIGWRTPQDIFSLVFENQLGQKGYLYSSDLTLEGLGPEPADFTFILPEFVCKYNSQGPVENCSYPLPLVSGMYTISIESDVVYDAYAVDGAEYFETENKVLFEIQGDNFYKTYKYEGFGYPISFEYPSTYTFSTGVPSEQENESISVCLLGTEVTPECDTYIEVVQEGDFDKQFSTLKEDYSGLVIKEGTRSVRTALNTAPVFWEISGYDELGHEGYTHLLLFEDQYAIYTILSDNEIVFDRIIESWGK